MILSFLLALLPQAQTIRIERPPATPFVVHATVPESGPLRAVGFPSQWSQVTPGTIEVSALVPGGTTAVPLEAGNSTGANLTDAGLAFLATPARLTLTIDGVPFSLSAPRFFKGWHRRGRALSTATMHRSLGAYGHAEWWLDSAADGRLGLTLLWHRAVPGPDVRFTSATLGVTGGLWRPVVVPPSCSPPFLVSPRADGARHIIPQQMGMAWTVEIIPAGAASHAEVVGIADWSGGGYFPAGLAVAPDTPRVPFAARAADERTRLAGLLPSPSWASVPTSPLWPASGARFGGEGGGDGRLPLDGVQWAASRGDADALEYYRIGLLRTLARARIRLEPDGEPLRLAGLPRTWSFDVQFLGGDDAPWEWDRWGTSWAGSADPRLFADHDAASLTRRMRHAWALAWLANEPLAKLLTLEGGTRAELTFGPFALPQIPGVGSSAGTREAQAALAVAAAQAFGVNYSAWAASYVATVRAVQMPSGCFTARLGGYPSELPPFDACPGVLLSGGEEFGLTMLALWSLGERDAVRRAAQGMAALATDDEPDDIGWYYYFPTGMGGTRYLHKDEWPSAMHDEMGDTGTSSYYTFHSTGYAMALALATGAAESDDLLSRTFGTSDHASVKAILRSWGTVAPSEYTFAPVEQWWPLYGVLQ